MSAWIVTCDHIDLIITAALTWELAVPEHADQLGVMLWSENVASVAYRYPSDSNDLHRSHDNEVTSYTHTAYPGRVDPQAVAIACASLASQSREHPAWDASTACAWLAQLSNLARQRTPEHIARYGPIEPDRQQPGQRRWYWLAEPDGTRTLHSYDAWAVSDRDAFHRTAALRDPTHAPHAAPARRARR